MFRGHHQHTIDKKGRTSVPARFREVLRELAEGDGRPDDGENLIVTVNHDSYEHHCLVAYPLSEWRILEDWIRKQNRFDDRVIALKRRFFSFASECSIDRLGRVLVPPFLRDFAGLSKDVVWTGNVDHIELWSLERWEAMNEGRDSEESRALMRTLGELSA